MSPATIFRAIENGQLRAATTPGGHYRITREDLEEFLKKNNIPMALLEPRTSRVLIVEDNPTELRFFQRALSKEQNLDVKSTASGYWAGFLTKSFKPDIIILDIFLKDMDGRQVAKLIRTDPDLKHSKIVAISATKDPKDLKEIKASGVDVFLPKPVSPADLRKTVSALLP